MSQAGFEPVTILLPLLLMYAISHTHKHCFSETGQCNSGCPGICSYSQTSEGWVYRIRSSCAASNACVCTTYIHTCIFLLCVFVCVHVCGSQRSTSLIFQLLSTCLILCVWALCLHAHLVTLETVVSCHVSAGN